MGSNQLDFVQGQTYGVSIFMGLDFPMFKLAGFCMGLDLWGWQIYGIRFFVGSNWWGWDDFLWDEIWVPTSWVFQGFRFMGLDFLWVYGARFFMGSNQLDFYGLKWGEMICDGVK